MDFMQETGTLRTVGDDEIGEIIPVERNWQTGKPTLGKSERLTGASVGQLF